MKENIAINLEVLEGYRETNKPLKKKEVPNIELIYSFLIKIYDLLEIKSYVINIYITNDSEIKELNLRFRNRDKATNILSFPAELNDFEQQSFKEENNTDKILLGDIIISEDTVHLEAKVQQKSLKNHYAHLIIHGFLHLLGYDHENEAEADIMEELEIKILEKLNIKNPYNDVA